MSVGFYLHAPDFDESARIASAKAGDVLPEECGRAFTLDAEVLYESGPTEFLSRISAFLESIGAQDAAAAGAGKFEAHLGGRPFVIVPETTASTADRWVQPALRMLAALDWFFEQLDAPERCYYTHIDNDSVVGFLTPRMAELVIELGEAVARPITLRRAVNR